MSINIQAKTDYSFLFSSLGSGIGNVASSNFLADYASIKNGSYGKLMKAYFSQNSNDSVKSIAKDSVSKTKADKLTNEETKKYAKVDSTSDALKDSADALLVKGSESLFNKKDITTTDENGLENTVKDYDTAAIYKAVDSFVTNYNAVIDAVGDVDNKSMDNRINNMVNNSLSNEKMLNQVGITVEDDGKLSLDKDTFMKADMTKAKNLFNGTGSYGYQVSASASMINYTAGYEASKASTYTGVGTYGNTFSSGNLFSTYF